MDPHADKWHSRYADLPVRPTAPPAWASKHLRQHAPWMNTGLGSLARSRQQEYSFDHARKAKTSVVAIRPPLEETMTQSRLPDLKRPTRRQVLKSAALGSAAAIAAPYVKGVYAAGSLSLGEWDDWVPGENNTLTKLCNEWGAKNNCEVKIDYITSQGEKDKLTAAAEAQAGTGHDIMSHRDWNIRIHQNVLEPLDDLIAKLTQQYGPTRPVAEYLAKTKGRGRGVPTAVGSQVKPCFSRIDLYKQHAGIDVTEIFPADESKWDQAKVDTWNWDTYLT